MLAQHLSYSDYRIFYVERQRAGDTIILDNGAYENMEPLSDASMVDWIKYLKPTVTVLPDFPLQTAHKTVSASLRFLDRYGDLPTEWMFIPQTTIDALNSWYLALNSVLNDMRVGYLVKWCGLPRNLHTHFGGVRVRVAAIVKSLYPELKLHALGMGDGSLAEYLALEPIVDSIDSSCAVWRGWNKRYLGEQWDDIPLDIYAKPADADAEEHIESNLDDLGYGKEATDGQTNSGR